MPIYCNIVDQHCAQNYVKTTGSIFCFRITTCCYRNVSDSWPTGTIWHYLVLSCGASKVLTAEQHLLIFLTMDSCGFHQFSQVGQLSEDSMQLGAWLGVSFAEPTILRCMRLHHSGVAWPGPLRRGTKSDGIGLDHHHHLKASTTLGLFLSIVSIVLLCTVFCHFPLCFYNRMPFPHLHPRQMVWSSRLWASHGATLRMHLLGNCVSGELPTGLMSGYRMVQIGSPDSILIKADKHGVNRC